MDSNSAMNTRAWVNMLVNEDAPTVRAPSSTPYLASKAKFTRSVDIPYTDTVDGVFSVICSGDVLTALSVTTPAGRIPSLPDTLVLASSGKVSCAANATAISSGTMVVTHDGAPLASVPFCDTGSLINQGPNGIPGLSWIVADGEPTKITIRSKNVYKVVVRMWMANGNYHDTQAKTYGDYDGTIELVNSYGQDSSCLSFLILGSHPVASEYHISIAAAAAQVARSPTPHTQCSALYSAEIMEQGKVESARCTSLKLLVTNMAPPITSGGELVIARAPARFVVAHLGVDLATAIKSLPESQYWRSGAIAEGAHAWWLPDDLDSYEPKHVNKPHADDNVLVATGRMSEGGLVRILASWTYEFYTPIQLFERSYNEPYTELDKAMWAKLSQQPAVSDNPGHVEVIRGLIRLATTFVAQYLKTDSLAIASYRTAAKAVSMMNKANAGATGGSRVYQLSKVNPKKGKKGENGGSKSTDGGKKGQAASTGVVAQVKA